MDERLIEQQSYPVTRLTIPVANAAAFRTEYEVAVPELPLAAVEQLVRRGAPWPEMLELIETSAPHGFLVYFRNDVHPVMSLAGDRAACVSYLMGNHTIAERMFRHDPRAMLYAPLHNVIWDDGDGDGWFTVDQPSTQFASFENRQIEEVGIELDHKLAALLEHLGVPVPAQLLDQSVGPPASRGR